MFWCFCSFPTHPPTHLPSSVFMSFLLFFFGFFWGVCSCRVSSSFFPEKTHLQTSIFEFRKSNEVRTPNLDFKDPSSSPPPPPLLLVGLVASSSHPCWNRCAILSSYWSLFPTPLPESKTPMGDSHGRAKTPMGDNKTVGENTLPMGKTTSPWGTTNHSRVKKTTPMEGVEREERELGGTTPERKNARGREKPLGKHMSEKKTPVASFVLAVLGQHQLWPEPSLGTF